MTRSRSSIACAASSCLLVLMLVSGSAYAQTAHGSEPDSDAQEAVATQVRGILSNRCFACHGPDEDTREGGFRLDEQESYLAEADSGQPALVPYRPQESGIWQRITSELDDERMPPADFGTPLEPQEKELIRAWIQNGGQLPEHWSFVAPVRPSLPSTSLEPESSWLANPIDRFVLAKQIEQGLSYSPPAHRETLLRRLALDLTGLPPDAMDVQQFISDDSTDAYERQVERLLASPELGEHWARKWLDLARYADSAGYADDPARTIWAFRDWVVRALNDNMPVDDFTIRQIAGDFLENPSTDDLVATAFHRNTLTNNEGGTNDEEFRNVAVVDRVNTTMAVWMGLTMGCAQCHSHKYDPFTQEEYFQLFAIFNQTQDSDKRDERPTLPVYTREQQLHRDNLERREGQLLRRILEPSPGKRAEYETWKTALAKVSWQALPNPTFAAAGETTAEVNSGGVVAISTSREELPEQDNFTLTYPLEAGDPAIHALRLKTLPGTRNFVVTNIQAELIPTQSTQAQARYLRIELPGKQRILSLAEVEVFSEGTNIADSGEASQSSTDYNGPAHLAIDGNTNGNFDAKSTTHTRTSSDPWWQLDLKSLRSIDQISLWNRTDNGLQNRWNGLRVQLLDESKQVVYESVVDEAVDSRELAVQPKRKLTFRSAQATFEQSGFPASATIDDNSESGWAIAGRTEQHNALTLVPDAPLEVSEPSHLVIRLEHRSPHKKHLLENFQMDASDAPEASAFASLDQELREFVKAGYPQQEELEQRMLEHFLQHFAPSTLKDRDQLSALRVELAAIQPATSVPILRQLATDKKRDTFVQIRGNYKSLGQQVTAGTPAALHPLPEKKATPDRLDFAHWLVDRRNPLTARVWVNRVWESLFGIGLVRSSEEFGSQGDRPSHPELLDWLAVEFMDSGWDNKHLLRLIVTSQTYQQTSAVAPQVLELDQDNIWLARGPRVRLSAEMVRDQALAVAGLLSRKIYGQPVRPPQPNLGLKAAFGSQTDWTTSKGEDRFRRGIYTTWRRSNPYPSMATFDAPSREVCTLRRDSTNTPLQALVTLNDPAFVEAAQGLARLTLKTQAQQPDAQRIAWAFRRTTSRKATQNEINVLVNFLKQSQQSLAQTPDEAMKLATDPIGSLPPESDPVEHASYVTLCNVLLNLDEVLMKR